MTEEQKEKCHQTAMEISRDLWAYFTKEEITAIGYNIMRLNEDGKDELITKLEKLSGA